MANSFSTSGTTKAPGEMAGPVKQPPVGGGGRGPQAPSLSGGPAAPPFQPTKMPPVPGGPQLDEFGRDPSAFLGSTKTPMAAVPDFNQRKANAAMMMPSAGAPPPQSMPGTGGPFMAGPQPFPPGPPQQADPPMGGGGGFGRQPMPWHPQGGFGQGGGGQGMFPGPGRMQPRQEQQGMGAPGASGGPMGPPPGGMQQMFQQPGFMEWLTKMFQSQQGGGGGQQGGPPQPGGLPAQQTVPMTQGPPR